MTTVHDRRAFLQRSLGSAAAASLTLGVGCSAQSSEEPPPAKLDEIAALEGDALWAKVRTLFSLDPNLTYMNNGGLGPSPAPVIEALRACMTELEAISEPGHSKVAAVRKKGCAFFNCAEEELAITRNTTESMNLIARGITLKRGDEILLSTHEHPGGSMPWVALVKEKGIQVKLFDPGGGGEDTLDRIASAITEQTRVISVSHVTCTTGLCVPAKQISRLARERGILSVYDGAQSAGMFPVDLHDMACDFYATSGHKWLLGSKGTGFLYVRKEMLDHWKPDHVGCYSDQGYDLEQASLEILPAARASEYGTRNTPVIVALGAALDFLQTLGMDRIAARGAALAARMKEHLKKMDTLEILTPMDGASSGSIVTFRPRDKSKTPWDWVNRIKKEYAIRLRPVGEHDINGVRISTHLYNSEEEVDRLADVLEKVFV